MAVFKIGMQPMGILIQNWAFFCSYLWISAKNGISEGHRARDADSIQKNTHRFTPEFQIHRRLRGRLNQGRGKFDGM